VLEPVNVPYVFFSDLEALDLTRLALTYGARGSLSKEYGVDVLLDRLRTVYHEIIDVRVPGGVRFR
jgi:DNA-binding NarL/FixJ family response regulator